MEQSRESVNTVLIKALRNSEQKRHFSTCTFLSSVSDYPDSVFNYDTNEQSINSAIRDAYKEMNVR